MASNYVPMEDLPQNLVPESDLPQEVQQAITQPTTWEERAAAPMSLWQQLTSPQNPRPFSFGNVAKDMVVGAGIGALTSGPTAVAGAGLGAAAGAIGGTFSELAAASGASPLTTFAAGVIGGEIPVVSKIAGKGIIKAYNYSKGKVVDSITPYSPKEASEIIKTKKLMYGDMVGDSLRSTEKSDILQNKLRDEFPDLTIPNNTKVSDVLRLNLYNDIKTQNNFLTSPEFNAFKRDVNILKEHKEAAIDDLKNVSSIFRTQSSKYIESQEKAPNSILNLIQKGGKYDSKEDKVTRLITKDTQEALKNRFDEFLRNNAGSRGGQSSYTTLKKVEAAEFGAKAEDAIHTLKQMDFNFGSTKAYEDTLRSLKNSPTGPETLVKGFTEYLGTLKDEKAMKTAFRKSAPLFDELKVMPRAEQDALFKKISEFTANVAKEKRAQVMKDLMLGALVGTQSQITSTEINRPIKEILSPPSSPISAFNM